MSPYATGGGGVTFERKVAVQYLAHLLVGDSTTQIGNGRHVMSVAFQQAPNHPVDDLVIEAKRPDESEPSLVLALAVRRSLNLVTSHELTRKLMRQFVHAVAQAPADGSEYRLGLVVSQQQPHAKELGELANLAAGQSKPRDFFELILAPGRFSAGIRNRLNHLKSLVKGELGDSNETLIEKRTWQILSRLTVSMPRLEAPDETDWQDVVNRLKPVVRDSDLKTALRLRNQLFELASSYPSRAAKIDLRMLRRDTHELLDSTRRLHQHGWQRLNSIDQQAREAVRSEIAENDGNRHVHLDQSDQVREIIKRISNTEALIISGESGVGKSALAVLEFYSADDADSKTLQILRMNLRHIPKLVIDLERFFECALCKLLNELSAPQRLLIIDGADAVTEDKHDMFKYLVNSAKASCVKVIAVTSIDSKEAVSDILNECFGSVPQEYVVSQLDESKIDKLIKSFPELEHLNANPRSRKILRRLVVVDLLVRGQISGIPLTDADAMNKVWAGLVRRHERSDRGVPVMRETTLLNLARLELGEGEPIDVVNSIDSSALEGLCRDGLLRKSPEDPFRIAPEFAHDEVRRYAVARLLLASGNNPGSRLLEIDHPRWSLAAARLACQAWLGRPDTSRMPLRGRFSELQASFDELVKKGHASRWGDVPTEALLMLAHPEALLRDAWPHLLAKEGAGLQRLFRLAKQQLYNKDGNIDIIAVEPIIKILLEETTLWQFRKQFREPVGKLLVSWLKSHIAANTPGGHPLRLLLQQHIMDVCAGADRRFDEERQAKAAERAAYTPEAVEHGRQRQEKDLISDIGPGSNPSWQRQKKIPNKITDELVLELLALLGADRGEEGEAILMRVARDAPHCLAPAVDDLILGYALLKGRSGLLADLTQAYYLDKDVENAGFSGTDSEGVRPHRKDQRSAYLGPFIPLFQLDFYNGVRVLNRLLNHAARVRVVDLVRGGYGCLPQSLKSESLKSYENKFRIAKNCKSYIGDEHVWCWYRGTGVGPDPCSSALQALEIVCEQLLKEINVPLKNLITIMLYDCENLAMLGLIVGLLIRHLEKADNLLDPFLTEPLIWHYEFVRALEESSELAARSDHLDSSERRKWSLQEAAVFMVVSANAERKTKLHALGDMLISNAQQLVKIAPDHNVFQKQEGDLVPMVRNWASCLDHSTYQTRKVEEGIIVETRAPNDVVQALQETSEAANLKIRAFKLSSLYSIKDKEMISKPINFDSLIDDIKFVKNLLNNPALLEGSFWGVPALVAAAALKANLIDRISLPDDVLLFSVEILLRTGEDVINRDQPKNLLQFDKNNAECSAAQILPLLLLPVSAQLRNLVDQESGSNTFQRAVNACFNLARVMTYEVRLYLARGLDHLWKTPACANNGSYHHELGWQMVIEMMRPCVIGPWNPETMKRPIVALNEPIIESLASTPGASIRVGPLDTAIRALAPAAMARTCISRQAKDLLLAILAAQQQALLADKAGYYTDLHGLQQTLVSARALLTLARDGDDMAIKAIYDHIDTYANNSALLGNFLSALSAAAEEAPDRAETAGKLWPNLFRYVLRIILSRDIFMKEKYYNDKVLASLIPNQMHKYCYREFSGNRIQWWKSLELKAEIEAWLLPAAGSDTCVNCLITYLDTFEPDQRAFVGLPWIEKLIKPDPEHIAKYSSFLPDWLIEVRESATTNDQTLATWQRIVDQLTVAGVDKLAQYSD